MQELAAKGIIRVGWISTHDLPADALTKCLSREAFSGYQPKLGMQEVTAPLDWQRDLPSKARKTQADQVKAVMCSGASVPEVCGQKAVASADVCGGQPRQPMCAVVGFTEAIVAFGKRLDEVRVQLHNQQVKLLIFELCTSEGSGFAQVCIPGVVTIQVTKSLGVSKGVPKLLDFLKHERLEGVCTLCWVSPPCTGGSPLLNLTSQPRRDELIAMHRQEFENILKRSQPLISKTTYFALELSAACAYWKLPITFAFTQKGGVQSDVRFDRCAYAVQSDGSGEGAQAKHAYRVCASWNVSPKQRCQCVEHMSLNSQSSQELGVYPASLVKEIVQSVLAHDT